MKAEAAGPVVQGRVLLKITRSCKPNFLGLVEGWKVREDRERHFSSVEGRASNTRPSHPARREEAESSCQWVEMHMSLEGCGQRPEPFLCCLPSQPLPWFQSFPGLESGTPQMDELAIGSPRPRHTLGPLPPWLFPFGPSIQLRLLCSCCPHPTGLNSVLGHSHV